MASIAELSNESAAQEALAKQTRASLERLADEWEALDRLKVELVFKLEELRRNEPRKPVHMRAAA